MSRDVIIRAEKVWKRYGLPLQPYLRRQLDRLRGRYQGDRAAYGPWALQDVSFEVRQGESLGIVGKNGAGKSTLLKLLAGVSPTTYGTVEVHGRLFPMIELAAGMHRDLTGRENIKLLGAIMGFTAQQMERKMPVIEAFAEMGDWLDKPVWQYSSGMQARLGFSVAVNVDADILLIDEVLSVGDVNFQKKCLARMDELASSGITVIFVTHNPYSIERICDRAIYLKDGMITAWGAPDAILTAYFQQSMDTSTLLTDAKMPAADLREGTGAFRIRSITMHAPDDGREISGFYTGDSVQFRIAIRLNEPTVNYRFSLRILDPAGTIVSFVDVPSDARSGLALHADETLECTIDNINLLPGEYWVDLAAKEVAGPIIDSIPFAFNFVVHASSAVIQRMENRGMIYLPAAWKLAERDAEGAADAPAGVQ